MLPHAHKDVYAYTHERTGADNGARATARGRHAKNASPNLRPRPERPGLRTPACAPRPARSAIGSPSAIASGRGRVGRRRAPAAARGCTARPQTRAAMAPRGADSQPAQPPAQPSGALLHRRRPRAHAAPPRLGSPLCVDPWMARDFVPEATNTFRLRLSEISTAHSFGTFNPDECLHSTNECFPY